MKDGKIYAVIAQRTDILLEGLRREEQRLGLTQAHIKYTGDSREAFRLAFEEEVDIFVSGNYLGTQQHAGRVMAETLGNNGKRTLVFQCSVAPSRPTGKLVGAVWKSDRHWKPDLLRFLHNSRLSGIVEQGTYSQMKGFAPECITFYDELQRREM
jgi:hypothetical protein